MMFRSLASTSDSSSGAFRCPPLFSQDTQEGDAFASTGMSNYGRTANSTFYNTSPLVNDCFAGPKATDVKINLEQSHLVDRQRKGSRIAVYQKTVDPTSSTEKFVSISTMPAYKDKSHEELRWEDSNFTGKGWFDVTSSTIQSRSLATNFSTGSLATTSIASIPQTQQPIFPQSNPFMIAFPSVATETTTWKYPGMTSTSFTSQPSQFSSFPNKFFTAPPPKSINPFPPRANFTAPASTTVSAAPLNLFDPFVPRTTLTSASSTTVSAAPLNLFNPFVPGTTRTSAASTTVSAAPLNLFDPFVPRTTLTSAASTTVSAAPLNLFNPFVPGTTRTSAASTTVSTAPLNLFEPLVPGTTLTSATSTAPPFSFAPLNYNPFINPATSLDTYTSTSNPFAAFTGRIDHKPSYLNSFWSTPITGPCISTGSATANSIPVSPVSSGFSSSFNQPTTLFTPSVHSAQNCNGTTTGTIGQSSVSQLPLSQITMTGKPSSAASPFGTLPPNPRMFIDDSQSKQPIQYGISSIPVKDKPTLVKYSLLTPRHLTGRIKLPVQKYDPKLASTKKPFFSEIPAPAYVPRENPGAFLVCAEKWLPRATTEIIHEDKFSYSTYENERDDPTKDTIHDVPSKLQQPDYYTQPQISELEANERAKPGYCACVMDFVVGRHGYGSIKFLGETDVRNVDIETHVQFNNREVIVYMDDSKKPPVGEGLNKAAEITLLNIKCVDKKTGMQYTHGSKVNRYTEMLKKKTEAHGAEFMSYDPVEGEWKFKVQHF